ncbi:MAG: 3-oxoacyl-ACP reductase FabG [Alicyclobacillaceae bacterium]|nr:3-oxoacyl-ACP reductase FabG [Alicyclobacillaceae bacterium]
MDLTGKVAIVTGSARGLGRGIAQRLARQGATVYITDVNEAGVRQTVDELAAEGLSVRGRVLNVADEAQARQCVEAVHAEHGRLDILVNNAGINRDAMLHKMTTQQWHEVLMVNLNGVFYMTQPASRIMREQRSGRIVNISSASWMGNVGQANYAAAKAGVVGLTKTAAKELAKYGVTANAICPGFIETDMTLALKDVKLQGPFATAWDLMVSKVPMGQAGKPEDVANMVAFLASDEARYITGEVINVGGGMVL